jgi:hypothetical protein
MSPYRPSSTMMGCSTLEDSVTQLSATTPGAPTTLSSPFKTITRAHFPRCTAWARPHSGQSVAIST